MKISNRFNKTTHTARSSKDFKLSLVGKFVISFLILITTQIILLHRYRSRILDGPNNNSLEANAAVATATASASASASAPNNNNTFAARPSKCTPEQKAQISKQLSPDHCNTNEFPYHQLCSFTKATKCPKADWLTSYYQQRKRKKEDDFVAVYVGCNKGYDAVNALRMGTGNPKYSKKSWRGEFRENYENVCNQNENDFPLAINNNGDEDETVFSKGTVHCIEPMTSNFNRLNASAVNLGWDDSFLVSKVAISQDNTIMFFMNALNTGKENNGLSTGRRKCKKYFANKQKMEKLKREDPTKYQYLMQVCEIVKVYTLDYYMDHIAKKKTDVIIEILSIDVEGFDFDVLMGGKETLQRTAYLEFEYNWMGSWKGQHLGFAIGFLESLNFTCYWAGEGKLWRLDDSCWLEHYDYHTWSNVACVNRKLNFVLAKTMEEIFLKTLEKDISL